MLIKVHTNIIIDVLNADEAEEACHALDSGLERQLQNFPHGEVVDTKVAYYENVGDKEAREEGWVEE